MGELRGVAVAGVDGVLGGVGPWREAVGGVDQGELAELGVSGEAGGALDAELPDADVAEEQVASDGPVP